MNVLQRNKRSIYVCSMYIENGIKKYKEPKLIKLNFEPTNSSEQVFIYGNTYPLYLKAIILNSTNDKFDLKAGDRCYIYNTPPKEHDILAKETDYIINTKPLTTLNFTEINFKRLTSDMNYE